MKDDLTKNKLLDTAVATSKKVVSEYEKAQKVEFYFMVVKYVAISLLALGIVASGYVIVTSGAKKVAVKVVTDVANEQVAEVKIKAEKWKEDTKKRAADLKEKQFLAGLGGSLAKLSNAVNKQVEAVVGGALAQRGYHPDAPARCIVGNDNNLQICEYYSFEEISGGDYEWIKSFWPNTCLETYKEAREILKASGKITKNDERVLKEKCSAVAKANKNTERERIKQEML